MWNWSVGFSVVKWRSVQIGGPKSSIDYYLPLSIGAPQAGWRSCLALLSSLCFLPSGFSLLIDTFIRGHYRAVKSVSQWIGNLSVATESKKRSLCSRHCKVIQRDHSTVRRTSIDSLWTAQKAPFQLSSKQKLEAVDQQWMGMKTVKCMSSSGESKKAWGWRRQQREDVRGRWGWVEMAVKLVEPSPWRSRLSQGSRG